MISNGIDPFGLTRKERIDGRWFSQACESLRVLKGSNASHAPFTLIDQSNRCLDRVLRQRQSQSMLSIEAMCFEFAPIALLRILWGITHPLCLWVCCEKFLIASASRCLISREKLEIAIGHVLLSKCLQELQHHPLQILQKQYSVRSFKKVLKSLSIAEERIKSAFYIGTTLQMQT